MLVTTNSVAFNVVNGVEIDADATLVTDNSVWSNGAAGVEVFDGVDNTLVAQQHHRQRRAGHRPVPARRHAERHVRPRRRRQQPAQLPGRHLGHRPAPPPRWSRGEIRKGLPNTVMELEFFASDTCDGSGLGESTTPLGTDFTMTTEAGTRPGHDCSRGPPSQVRSSRRRPRSRGRSLPGVPRPASRPLSSARLRWRPVPGTPGRHRGSELVRRSRDGRRGCESSGPVVSRTGPDRVASGSRAQVRAQARRPQPGRWQQASTLLPSGSRRKAP